jgi:hypothetical protein
MERRTSYSGTQLTPGTRRCFESQAHQGPDDGVPPWNCGKFVLSAAFFLNEWLRIGARPFEGSPWAASGWSSASQPAASNRKKESKSQSWPLVFAAIFVSESGNRIVNAILGCDSSIYRKIVICGRIGAIMMGVTPTFGSAGTTQMPTFKVRTTRYSMAWKQC